MAPTPVDPARPEPGGTCPLEPRLGWAIASIVALSVFAHTCIGIYLTSVFINLPFFLRMANSRM